MRIAIISDLHVHHETDVPSAESWLTSGAPRSPWTNHPIASLERLVSLPGMQADVILCPGDLANRGSVRGIASAFSMVDGISGLNGAPTIVTPGNHDVLTLPVAGGDLLAPLRPFMGRIPIADIAASTALWRDHFTVIDHGEASFLVINTTGKATDRATARRGVFDEELRDALRAYLSTYPLKRIRVAVFHHHPLQHSIPGVEDADILQRGDELIGILTDKSFALVVHGHKHQARLSYGQSGSDGPAVLASGSISAIPKGSLITLSKNLFHLVDVDVGNIPGMAFAGFIRTWQFVHGDGWVPASTSSTKFPHIAGFGCRFPTASLAAAISSRVGGATRWSDLVGSIDGLEYVAPDDQTRVFEHLESSHGIDVAFDRRGDPHILTPKRAP